jgi:N-acetylglucosaminyldiphosphoundecaprenol N-acetyl-beta-D-mannosaminyltransferase
LKIGEWRKRSFDLSVSIVVSLVLGPLIIIGHVLSGCSIKRTARLGQFSSTFDELSFDTNNGMGGKIVEKLHLTRLPVLFNIVKGDMSFVGPLPKAPTDLRALDPSSHDRYSVRPGLISLWWIRRRGNIDYETEYASDMEYVENHSFWGDIGICLRAIPAMLYGDKGPVVHEKVNLMGITIDNLTMDAAIQTVLGWLNNEDSKQICFVNADCVNIAVKNKAYLGVLRNADLCLADGIGVKLAGKVLSQHIAQNLCGTDMFPLICERISNKDVKLFLLGARLEAVEGAVRWISAHYPNVKVCGYYHGYFQPDEESEIIQLIKESRADLLLVALGVPKQDMWIHEHLNETGVRVAMGVGGLFDFYSGRIPRAPLWMREIGMEWLYRLIQEPRRLWKRYLIGNGLFLWRILMERFSPIER